MATKQFDHGFRCFTRHRRPQDKQIFCLYGSCVFRPCMRTGWVLEMSPSDHYWQRHEVGQWLGFWWFWGWGISDLRLARRKLDKNTPQSWQPPSPYSPHGALPLAPLHTTSLLLKLENIISFTMYLLAILRHDASSTCCA
jgi:hypothetical protein